MIASIIACPTAYFVLNRWLNDFAYRTPLGLELFVILVAMAFGIALTVASIKVIKAAIANPVEALRYE
jgi:putative ABC transport system permease protein